MDWRKLISQNVGQEMLPNISTFIRSESIIQESPIDTFYKESREVLLSTPHNLNRDNWRGCANVVILVSLTENYFRAILGEILEICSVTKKNAAENNINFGSALWHPNKFISRGAFEHISFSDSKKIIEITRKYIGLELNNSDLIPILNEFSKVCELRHGIVHSGRYMAGKNAIILDVPPTNKFVKISIGYGELQIIASICTTLVISFNKKMFETLCKRWATVWRNSPNWDSNLEDMYIKKIWKIFFSKIDKNDGTIEENGTWIKCRNLLKAEYNII